ncbi:hypothetical protein K6W16_22550 [Burkholderia dolosa]|uniref:Uncharacterized protein n=1 Tax=Burkholderia dolosa TaxID=152500 RepID=A0A892HZA7_9BURK|nr:MULTISPECIES: hypothetical protein [Burkholderia]MBR8417436.1 hypothetical protein [Burkholderia dolosa]MBY4657518.1 hypothetical protein [Burkholderia dolosa]MBY4688500.1 hypothetical protein [Burkholderia dolosa]MBY4784784.1 hypothetical protein [Burkholderia dolosa]MBY4786798.1 hypothetical protein [Burkholderia dolosa]
MAKALRGRVRGAGRPRGTVRERIGDVERVAGTLRGNARCGCADAVHVKKRAERRRFSRTMRGAQCRRNVRRIVNRP